MKSGILILMTALAGIGVSIDGAPVEFGDQEPANIEGRTLVPVRAVFEALGFSVDWDAETQTAHILRGADALAITLGSDTFTANGASRALDVPA
ncbi:MAG: copper amine oxidase N-terminal domain-containing protein, partial [Clostridiales bacterium]|nr:copper amine oxidase N-terminal domain-containing protein [Clostridiales bacterium]